MPFATKEAVIHFDKALIFSPKKFKTCSAAKVQASETSCPKGSKVGSGSAVGTAIGQTSNLKVSAFNGPKGKLMLHVTASTPLQIDAVIQASLKKDKGKYGSKLVVPIPENLQQPVPGVFATLKQFVTSVKATSKGVPYVGLASCPKSKKLSFKGDFTFTDGTTLSATDTVKCKPASRSPRSSRRRGARAGPRPARGRLHRGACGGPSSSASDRAA